MSGGAAQQTISYLRRRLAEAGIRPGARYGQHFLVDQNLLRLIVERAEIDEHDVVLEVGTGTGGLAALLAPRAAALWRAAPSSTASIAARSMPSMPSR